MLIAIDGACKRNGDPTCSSSGVAFIETEAGNMLYKAKFETCSTSQRGEINGLLEALYYAVENSDTEEDIIIVTDSEYLYNTVTLEWVNKWQANNWYGAVGKVKNSDLWATAWEYLSVLNKATERVFMQWTKGHLLHYTPGNIKKAMQIDPLGIELYSRIAAIANRPAERSRLVLEFIRERSEHDKESPPEEIALEWVIANTVADSLASYIVRVMDNMMV